MDHPIRTVVFTDIEGSTRLLRRLGTRFDALLERHHALIRRAIAAHNGEEVGTEGDAFFVLFDSPSEAVDACVLAQTLLGDEAWPDDAPIRVRMGVHVGEVRPGADNYIGLGVHQAARVAPAAHGGQVIVSQAVAASIPEGVGLLDLGAFHLRDFDEPQHLFQVLHPNLATTFPPPRAASAIVHNLPAARTSFVGRERDIDELIKLTDTERLITVVGAGGVGKTRLATEVGLRVAGRYPEGVWLVSLGSVVADRGVADQAKAAIGVTDQPGVSTAQMIANRFDNRAALVILDNCEHVLDGCANFADELLAASPALTVLATSREHLGLLGEQVVRVGQLPEATASALFAARGRQADREFAIDDATQDDVAAICALLDGIPLALELAAARLAIMSVGELRQRLDEAPGLLDASHRGGDARQRTLRSTIDWSYQLLKPDAQRMLRGVAAFRGGFTLDAAAAVVEDNAAIEQLDQLVAQSLVEIETDRDEPRYRLLETIRAYATEELAAKGERRDVLTRHADFFCAFARQLAPDDSAPSLDALAGEHPNLLAALDHLEGSPRARDHGRLVADLETFWNVRGHWVLGTERSRAFLERSDADAELAVAVVGALGALRYHLGDYAGAKAAYMEALAGAKATGNRRLESHWRGSLGTVATSVGDYAEAQECFATALGIARELDLRRDVAVWVGNLGTLAFNLNDFGAAAGYYEESLAFAREDGDRRAEGRWIGTLAAVANARGNYDAAKAGYIEALAIAREIGDRRLENYWVGNIGATLMETAENDEARVYLEEGLELSRALGDRGGEGHALGNLGIVNFDLGAFTAARVRLSEALEIAEEMREPRLVSTWSERLALAEFALGDTGQARTHLAAAVTIMRDLGYRDPTVLDSCAAVLAGVGEMVGAATVLAAAESTMRECNGSRGHLQQDRFDAAWSTCESNLSASTLHAAQQRGTVMGWDAVCVLAADLLAGG